MDRPIIEITAEHIEAAEALEGATQVHRTKVSPVDTLGGILGEFVFAEWLTGDWRNHEVGANKGKADLFGLVEVKTSIFPFKDTLNLVVREDYGRKFKHVYVQQVIDVADARIKAITPGTPVVICGFATHEEATRDPARQMPMGRGQMTPYKVFARPISLLTPMQHFKDVLRQLAAREGMELPF